MVDEKAAAYAKEHAGEGGDVLKIYEAYRDGHGDMVQARGWPVLTCLIGIIIGMGLLVILHDRTNQLCEYKRWKAAQTINANK